METLFLWIFMSFQRRSTFGSKTFLFLVKISPSLKHPKKAIQQMHQKVLAKIFSLKVETILLFISFSKWNVMAFRVGGLNLLFLRELAFLNPFNKVFVRFLLFLNFLKPKKL